SRETLVAAGRDLRLDLVLEAVRQLEPPEPEELNPVVLGRVVGRGDHHAGLDLELGREERDARGGHDAGADRVTPAGHDALYEGVLQDGTRRTGVATDHERRRSVSVARQHGDRRAPERTREIDREVASEHASNAVRSEEPPQRARRLPE